MKYEGLQSILNGALGDYQSKGFRLVEQDDHILLLFYQDERVAMFNQTTTTIPIIQRFCDQWLLKVGVC